MKRLDDLEVPERGRVEHEKIRALVAGEAGQVRQVAAQMLAYQVDGRYEQVGPAEAFLQRIGRNPGIGDELEELAGLLRARSTLAVEPLPGASV